MSGLTKKQHDLLCFIESYIDEHGYSPSYEEMMDGLDHKSKSTIHRLITCLEQRGYVRRIPQAHRGIEVLRSATPIMPNTKSAALAVENSVLKDENKRLRDRVAELERRLGIRGDFGFPILRGQA